jgi:hypothetical protein
MAFFIPVVTRVIDSELLGLHGSGATHGQRLWGSW